MQLYPVKIDYLAFFFFLTRNSGMQLPKLPTVWKSGWMKMNLIRRNWISKQWKWNVNGNLLKVELNILLKGLWELLHQWAGVELSMRMILWLRLRD